MNYSIAAVGLIGLWLACSALGVTTAPAGEGAHEGAPEDARFVHRDDKDHPANFVANFPDRASWQARADVLREQALVALGLWPMPTKTPIEPVIHGKVDRGEYTIEKVFFASLPGHYVTGNLYRPKGRTGKLPAVLAPYGHWPSGRFVWNTDDKIKAELASGAETSADAARSPLQAGCAMLAKMGCVVFQYDMVGYCDSSKIEHRLGFLDADAILRAQSFMGLQTWNSIRAADFIGSLPDVDPQRIGVGGASSGGTQTIMLSVTDRDAVAAAFPMVMVSMNMQGGCVCENAPLLRIGTNNVELASLFAPNPQGAAAAKDWTIDFETRGLPEMKTIYGLFGAGDRIEGKFFPYPHNFNLHSREMMYEFFNRELKLGLPSPVKEEKFEPLPPKELSVWDASHPEPADSADAVGVRKWMTDASDKQLAEMAKNPVEYMKVLRSALRAMVVDSPRGAGEVEVINDGASLDAQPGTQWNGFIARKGTGERIPCAVTIPKDWNGDVIVWADSDAEGWKRVAPKAAAAHSAVLSIGVFMTGPFRPRVPLPPPTSRSTRPNPPYEGYVLGYNRSTVANQVHDLLSAVALAKSWGKTRRVHLAALGEAGPAGLLATAMLGEQITHVAIDLNHFDFDTIKHDDDPMLLPGALKYGGIYGFLPLCSGRAMLLGNPRKNERYSQLKMAGEITVEENLRSPDDVMAYLLR